MEDVKKLQLFRRLLVGVLLSACFIVSISFAATQGTIGRTSVGSVSITVIIPETVQFIVNSVSDSLSLESSYVCFSVLNRNSTDSYSYYRIQDDDESSALLRLKNYRNMPIKNVTECDTEKRIVREIADSNVTLFMFVPE
ncbi:MAG: hypothetical protein R8G33_03855 [Gammaproteobacteria bacterium]|nr:hypothetical protein [Gammaproteobacteria bacterium]